MDTHKNPISLKLNKPVSTTVPTIDVRGFLIAGEYQVQLVAVDQFGKHSQATVVRIIVNPPLTLWSKMLAYLERLFGEFVIPFKNRN